MLKIELPEYTFSFEINDFKKLKDGYQWCKTSYGIESEIHNIHFFNKDWETLDNGEVEALAKKLDDFIEGKVIKEERLGFTEPDFVFMLRPRKLEDGIDDIKMDVCISLWESNMRLSGEKVEFSLYREDIEKFRDYLKGLSD